VLLNLGAARAMDTASWSDRVQCVDATYAGKWELPVLGEVAAPDAVLIRPDGYVAWVGDGTRQGLAEALTTWFGAPAMRQARGHAGRHGRDCSLPVLGRRQLHHWNCDPG